MIRFMLSTCPFVHGWLALVNRCLALISTNSVKGTGGGLRAFPAAGEPQAVVGKDSVGSGRQVRNQLVQKHRRSHLSFLLVQFRVYKFARPVDRHEELDPTLICLHLGDANVEKADPVLPELPLPGLFGLLLWKAADVVALEAVMHRRAQQMRHHLPKRVRTIMQWQ